MSPVELRPFDLVNYIRSEEGCRFLMEEARAEGDPDFLVAVQDAIARWREQQRKEEVNGAKNHDHDAGRDEGSV